MEQRGNIPPRYALRLDDLRPWHVIIATCAVCRRRAHVAAALLQHGRPPYTRVLVLERKLCCTGCGNGQGRLDGAKELNAFTGRLAQRHCVQPFRLALVNHVR
jgi:hypothetical protein